MTVGEQVRHWMGELTAAERKAARVLLGAYPIAGLETLARFAGRAQVSPPTVTRFVTKLGYDGYPDFQRALREEIQARMSSPLSLYDVRGDGRGGSDLLRSSHEVFSASMRTTFQSAPEHELDRIVERLADRRSSVHCTGGRFSKILAFYLYAHLHQLRPGTRYIGSEPLARHDMLVDLARRDILVVFDYRRYETGTVALARQAAAQGAAIILFTDRWLSPVVEVADHLLTSEVDAPSPFDSIVPAFALVETVIAGLVTALGEEARQRVEALEQVRGRFGWTSPDTEPASKEP